MTTESSITVTGDADVKVAPDEVVLSLGVESQAQDLVEAKAENDARIKNVIAAAKASGIEDKWISTDQISIEPHYDSHGWRSGKPTLEGFQVRRSIQLTLRDVSKFDVVLTNAVAAGANQVHGVHFATTELRRHRDHARSLAMKAAHEKATALAHEYGMKIGPARDIQETGGRWFSSYGMWGSGRGGFASQNVAQNLGSGGSVDGTMALGSIAVSASVTVVFALLS